MAGRGREPNCQYPQARQRRRYLADLGLAGEWYRWFIAKHQTAAESDREAELGWWFERISFLDDLEELAPQWFREQAERTEGDWRQWLDDPSVRVKARSIVADYGHTAQFLADRGLVLTAHARDLFLDWVQDEFLAAAARAARRR